MAENQGFGFRAEPEYPVHSLQVKFPDEKEAYHPTDGFPGWDGYSGLQRKFPDGAHQAPSFPGCFPDVQAP